SSELRKCGGCTSSDSCGFCQDQNRCLRPNSDGSGPWLPEHFECADWRFRGSRSEEDLTEAELCSQFVECDTETDCGACASSYWELEQGCVWCAPNGAEYKGEGSCHRANGTVCSEVGNGLL